MIEFRGVTKRFPDGTVAVDQLDLTVDAGKITVFVGPSGCGKTTSLRMINRMIDVSEGTIEVDGRDINSVDAAELRRGIGYVIQQAGLFPHRTILDNVATVPLLLGWNKAKARSRAAELMEIVGLAPEMAKRYPAQLSGGQQQRVGVARALAADPPVLLMDEPFSAVDPVVRESLQEELLRLQGELGKTIVFVTHDIDEAVKLGDKVAVFRTGGSCWRSTTIPARCSPVPPTISSTASSGATAATAASGSCPRPRCRWASCPPSRSAIRCPEAEGWTLVVDAEQRPQGWLRGGSGPVTAEHLVPGGSLYEVSVRFAAQRARRGAVLAVRPRGRDRRRRRRGRLGQRRRRAARPRGRPARRDRGVGASPWSGAGSRATPGCFSGCSARTCCSR